MDVTNLDNIHFKSLNMLFLHYVCFIIYLDDSELSISDLIQLLVTPYDVEQSMPSE
ncbi:hypothetical protein HanIR_Chr01g0036301 [Helianthus annuus]|nr:hypothetical protein HanIR_Chr01g0036301 [Helianthus annuus]